MKMKKWISFVLLMTQTSLLVPAVASADIISVSVRDLVKDFKEEVLVLGISPELATEHLITRMQGSGVSLSDLQLFFGQQASRDEQAIYDEVLHAGLTLSPETTQWIVTAMMESSGKRGAHFKVSCGLGLGVSIPILLAGLTVGVIYLANQHEDQKIQSNYASDLSRANSDYFKTKGSLENSLLSQSTDIATRQNQIAYINQEIQNGVYSAQQREQMYQQIAALNAEIASIKNSTAGINAQLDALQDNYNQQLITLSTRKSGEVLDWKQSQTTQQSRAITAIAIGGAAALSTTFFACENRSH
jgi:hypothetical protein